MNRIFNAKSFFAAAVAAGALAAGTAAHARSDVHVSIGVQPFGYTQPAPVYVQPRHVYVQPQPVYYNGHDRRYERNGAWGDSDRDGVPNIHDRNSRYYNAHAAQRARPWGDADRDGVPNRYDRAPTTPHRR